MEADANNFGEEWCAGAPALFLSLQLFCVRQLVALLSLCLVSAQVSRLPISHRLPGGTSKLQSVKAQLVKLGTNPYH